MRGEPRACGATWTKATSLSAPHGARLAGRSGACRRRPRAAPPRLALTVYRLGKATSKPAVGRAVGGTWGTAHRTRNTGARAANSAPGTRNRVSAASSVFPEPRSSCVTSLALAASLRPASAVRTFGQIPGARAVGSLTVFSATNISTRARGDSVGVFSGQLYFSSFAGA